MPRAPGRLSSLSAALRRARAADPRLFRVRAALISLAVPFGVAFALLDDPAHRGLALGIADPDKHVRPTDLARAFGWEAAAAGVLLCAALAASARSWLGPAEIAPDAALAARAGLVRAGGHCRGRLQRPPRLAAAIALALGRRGDRPRLLRRRRL
jgi:hypothetical protein